MTSHYTWGSVDHIAWFWRCVGTVFGHLFWALTISWSWLLARVWSGPHTREWPCDHCTSSILIGGKRWASPSSLHTTLEGPPEWVQDGCKVDMDSYMTSKGSCIMVTWIIFLKKTPLGGRPHTNLGDHGTPNAHNRRFILVYHPWGSTWIKKNHWNSIWLKARWHMTSHYTWKSMTTLHDYGGVLGWPLDTFFWGSHNVMITALNSCVKWPLT